MQCDWIVKPTLYEAWHTAMDPNPCKCSCCETCELYETLAEVSQASAMGAQLLDDGKIDLREALELMNDAV